MSALSDSTPAVDALPAAIPSRGIAARWPLGVQLTVFLLLAYGLSWWPWPLTDLDARPDAALMVPIGPSIAGLVMAGLVYGRPGVRALLRATVRVKIGRWWVSLLIPVGIAALGGAAAVLVGATGPATTDVATAVAAAAVSLPLVLVVAGPLGEEIGWRGYVLPTLLGRYGPVVATLILTPMWVGFHLPWILNAPDRFGPAWAVALLGMALTMTWLHVRTGGSVALAIVFHAVINTATPAAIRLFPEDERSLVWAIVAGLWLATGVAAGVALAKKGSR